MKRVLVIGPGGAGKSTFARKLSSRTKLPLTALDELYWQPGWVATPHPDWARIVSGLVEVDEWLLDGNYSKTLPIRLAAADTVFFFDFPRRRYVLGSLVRLWKNRGAAIQAPGCPEHFSPQFLRFLWRWRSKKRPAVLQMLEQCSAGVVVFNRRSEAERYLSTL